ncbi:MAG: T9SS type A sorting domain-containing protein [Bacteroidales bacterium]|jgi:hypothetical protein
MKKIYIVIMLAIIGLKVNAQWNNYLYLSTFIEPYFSGTFCDANFLSLSSGMYSYNWDPSPDNSSVYIQATIDNGNTWSNVYYDSDMGISSLAIEVVRNQNTYFHIRNWQGIIYIDKSSNNGASWDQVLGEGGYYQDFSATDISHLFLLYYRFSPPFYISKYINGIVTNNIDTFTTVSPQIMFFPDTATGYIAAYNSLNSNNHLILKSVTAGTNWVNVFDDSLMNIRKMFFISANVGFAAGDSGKMIKTINGGTGWQYLNTGITVNLNSIYFLNDTIGFVAGDSGKIIRTIDGGSTWHQDTTSTLSSFYKIFFVNDSIGMALAGQEVYTINLYSPTSVWEKYTNPKQNLMIYPNPATNNLTIVSPQNAVIEITNIQGQLIKTLPPCGEAGATTSNKTNIDVSALPCGVYIVEVKTEKGIEVRKFIKE